MKLVKKLDGQQTRRDRMPRRICHVISIAITAVLTVFAADGATTVWPTHPVVAQLLAALCAIAAGIGHVRLCAQISAKQPTQNRFLLGLVILIFGMVSVILGSIAEYRDSVQPATKSDAVPFFEARAGVNPTANGRPAGPEIVKPSIERSSLLRSFFADLLSGAPDALLPFLIGCFLEVLPLATLLLAVPQNSSSPSSRKR